MPRSIIKVEELQNFSPVNLPKTEYLGDILFPDNKYQNVKFAWLQVTGKSLLPVIANVSALDAEAPIRQRPDVKEITAEALLIKHKINLTEHAGRLKYHGMGDEQIKSLVFDDVGRLWLGVKARVEAMKMELLANGNITIKENNIDEVVSYDFPAQNIFITDLTNASTDVFDLIDRVKAGARSNGKAISMAVISSKVLDYLYKNTGLLAAWKNSSIVITPTKDAFFAFLQATFGVQFVLNDDVYKYEQANGTEVISRFYPEDRISFICGVDGMGGQLGVGAYAPTPEEEMLEDAVSLDGKIVATVWDEKDPAAQWTKCSGVALPIIRDVDDLYIVYTE